jgi:hypothetical protein
MSFLMTETGGVAGVVNNWYRQRYGEALYMDTWVGRTVVEFAGAIWRLKVPLVLGRVRFVVDPRQGLRGNILDYFESDVATSLPVGLREGMSVADLRRVRDCFVRASRAFTVFTSEDDMARSARANLATAVWRLTSRPADFGLSRWESLQAVEKLLKAALAKRNHTFPTSGKDGHNLKVLARMTKAVGVVVPEDSLLVRIQCPASVRYNASVSSAEALEAHYASLEATSTLGPQL